MAETVIVEGKMYEGDKISPTTTIWTYTDIDGEKWTAEDDVSDLLDALYAAQTKLAKAEERIRMMGDVSQDSVVTKWAREYFKEKENGNK